MYSYYEPDIYKPKSWKYVILLVNSFETYDLKLK
jgi:hypothetical protein